MKRVLTLVALMALAITHSVAQPPDPCPDPDFGVEAACRPAPPWTLDSGVIKLSEHCYVMVYFCTQWVCRGHFGLSRSRVSISSVRFFNDLGGGGFGTGEGCPEGPIDEQELKDLMTLIISKGIEQNIWQNDGRPKPCAENPQDMLFEVVRGICATQATWQGTIFHPTSGGPKHFTGVVVSFCQTELACQNRYLACTDKFGKVVTTLIDSKVMDANGAVLNPPYPPCSQSFNVPSTGGFVYEGIGDPVYGGVEGVDYILNIYGVGAHQPCTFSCTP